MKIWMGNGLTLTALLLCALFLGAAVADDIPLEKKYSLTGFEKLRWEVHPSELAGNQELDSGVWKLTNPTPVTMLLLAPYAESNIALAVDIFFQERNENSFVGVFLDYVHHEHVDSFSYLQLLVYPDGRYSFGHTVYAAPSSEKRGRFPLLPRNPGKVTLRLTRLRDHLFLTLNDRRLVIQEGVEGQGGFGFLVGPGSRVQLSEFRFTVYGEMENPFKGVDPAKLFPTES